MRRNFIEHMSNSKKRAFYYLIEKLDNLSIKYKFTDNFYITGIKDVFCEIQDDFSYELDKGKQTFGSIKTKKDVDELISLIC